MGSIVRRIGRAIAGKASKPAASRGAKSGAKGGAKRTAAVGAAGAGAGYVAAKGGLDEAFGDLLPDELKDFADALTDWRVIAFIAILVIVWVAK